MDIYMFNNGEVLTGLLSSDEFMTCTHTLKMSGENYIEFSIPADITNEKSDLFHEGYFIGFYDVDNAFQMFEIITMETSDDTEKQMISGYAEHVSYELIDNLILDKRAIQKTASAAIAAALTGSRWVVSTTENFGIKTQNFYYESSLSALNKIRDMWTYIDQNGKTAKGFFSFRLTLSGNTITNRYVDFKKQQGSWSGKRIIAGKDLDNIKRKVDMSSLCTAAYGKGKGVEVLTNKDGVVVAKGTIKAIRKVNFEGISWNTGVTFADETFDTLARWDIVSGNCSISTNYNFEGTTSLRMLDQVGNFPCVVRTKDYIPVAAGVNVRVYAKLLVPDNSSYGNSKSKLGRIRIIFYTSAHVVITWIWNTMTVSYADNGLFPEMKDLEKWQDLICEWVAPATTAYIKVELRTADGGVFLGNIYWDMIKIGDPVNKPLNQGYVADTAALALWGRGNGTIHRMKIYEDESEDDPYNLLTKTYQFVKDNNSPKITYECDAKDLELALGYTHEAVRLGDLVYVLDENFRTPIEITARIMELSRDIFNPRDVNFVLGNFQNDAADLAYRQQVLGNTISSSAGVWDMGTVFETTPNGNTRFRMVEVDGVWQSEIRYEDDASPPNLIGYFNPTEFSWSTVRANKFIGQNILMVNQDDQVFYIDSYSGDDANDGSITTPWATISRLNNPLAIPKYIMNPIVVNIEDSTPAGTTPYTEHIVLSGITGSSQLDININANVVINGSFSLYNCAAEININGVAGASINATENIAPLYADSCFNLLAKNMIFNAANLCTFAVNIYASKVQIIDSTLERVSNTAASAALRAAKLSQVQLLRCIGSNPYGYAVTAYDAAYVGVHQSRPFAGLGSANRVPFSTYNAGSIIAPSAMTGDTFPAAAKSAWDTGGAAPAPPAATTTATMTVSETKSWRFSNDSYRTDSDDIYQGSWGYGKYIGLWLFNGTFDFDDLLGKTIRSGKMWIRRRNAGGYSSAQQIHLWGHNYKTITGEPTLNKDYGMVASLKWGEELGLNLPKTVLADIKAGTINGLAIYVSGDSPYVILQGKSSYSNRIVFTYDT